MNIEEIVVKNTIHIADICKQLERMMNVLIGMQENQANIVKLIKVSSVPEERVMKEK